MTTSGDLMNLDRGELDLVSGGVCFDFAYYGATDQLVGITYVRDDSYFYQQPCSLRNFAHYAKDCEQAVLEWLNCTIGLINMTRSYGQIDYN